MTLLGFSKLNEASALVFGLPSEGNMIALRSFVHKRDFFPGLGEDPYGFALLANRKVVGS
jgi:hypothetical protein